jgi:hypothetical protein
MQTDEQILALRIRQRAMDSATNNEVVDLIESIRKDWSVSDICEHVANGMETTHGTVLCGLLKRYSDMRETVLDILKEASEQDSWPHKKISARLLDDLTIALNGALE